MFARKIGWLRTLAEGTQKNSSVRSGASPKPIVECLILPRGHILVGLSLARHLNPQLTK